MVDHGIETQDERIAKSKPKRGTIKIEFKNHNKYFSINLTNDGGGIDSLIIKKRINEKNLKPNEEINHLPKSDIINLIFLAGFSTKDNVTDISGRGIVMDAVKKEVEKIGGKIMVVSEINQGTSFTITLPFLNQN
jgi:two-component system, chemotaxis family, sensor kinase CheA